MIAAERARRARLATLREHRIRRTRPVLRSNLPIKAGSLGRPPGALEIFTDAILRRRK